MPISKQDVFSAATALVADGIKPTWAAVRARLGKGSYSTIGRWLREWQALPDVGAAPLHEEVRRVALRHAAEIWELALREARKSQGQ